jgi:IPT/TIG domain
MLMLANLSARIAGVLPVQKPKLRFDALPTDRELTESVYLTPPKRKKQLTPEFEGQEILCFSQKNCQSCLETHGPECGLCEQNGKCCTQEQCDPTDISHWHHGNFRLMPIIETFYPTYGPVAGGTVITIEGKNLGRATDLVRYTVEINGVNCSLVMPLNKTGTKIVCKTGRTLGMSANKGRITIMATLIHHLPDFHPTKGRC